jgi:glutathione S-transferase
MLHSKDEIITTPGNQVKPEVNQNFLRLYDHNLCPFASRARYALALAGIEFQQHHMDLKTKAQWHVDYNGGMVPVLETPSGQLIKESAIIAQLAVEIGKGKGIDLVSSDPFVAAKLRLEVERLNS